MPALLGQLVRLARNYYQKLERSIRLKENDYKLPLWKQFVESVAFKSLEHFLLKEEVIVRFEMDSADKLAQPTN